MLTTRSTSSGGNTLVSAPTDTRSGNQPSGGHHPHRHAPHPDLVSERSPDQASNASACRGPPGSNQPTATAPHLPTKCPTKCPVPSPGRVAPSGQHTMAVCRCHQTAALGVLPAAPPFGLFRDEVSASTTGNYGFPIVLVTCLVMPGPCPGPRPQPLPTHPRRTRLRDLLHQSPQPGPAAPAQQPRTTNTGAAARGAAHHQRPHRRTGRRRTTTAGGRLKPLPRCQRSSDQGSLATKDRRRLGRGRVAGRVPRDELRARIS